MSDNPAVIEDVQGREGAKRWLLLRRPHGLYTYEELTLADEIYHVDEIGSEGAVVAEAYWQPTYVSGLFDSIAAARENAISTLPWLRGALANGS